MADRWESQVSSLRRVAFDSNALIYLLNAREPYARYVAQVIAIMESGQAIGFISTVVEMELLGKPTREKNFAARDRAEAFLRETHNLAVRPVDRTIARRAADVRARTRLAPLDSIIVATGLEERCEAIIGNDSIIASRSTGIPYFYLDDYL